MRSGIAHALGSFDPPVVLVRSSNEALRPRQDGLTAALYRPGAPVPTYLSARLLEALSVHWQIDRLVVGLLGFPPIPLTTDGWAVTGDVDGVGHPVFWLPRETRRGNFFEADEYEFWRPTLEQLRLWFEISARGLGDLASGTVEDVLSGVDRIEPQRRECVLSLEDEVRSSFWEQFTRACHDDYASDELLAWFAADQVLDTVRALAGQWMEAEVRDRNFLMQAMRARIDSCHLAACVVELASGALPSPELADVLECIRRDTTGVSVAALLLEEHERRRTKGYRGLDLNAEVVAISKAESEISETVRYAHDALLSSGCPEGVDEVIGTASRWLHRAHRAAARARPMSVDDLRLALPPLLAVPATTRPQLDDLRHRLTGLVTSS